MMHAKTTPVRLIQIGFGGWGRNWLSTVLPQHDAVELVACVDQSTAALDTLRKEHSVPASMCFGSLNEAMTSVEADAVLITTALEGHVPLAMEALQHGLHVLTEKPFAPSLEEADRAVAAAERAGRVLMVSQNYRYYPAPRKAAEIVRSGRLGKLGTVHIDFRRNKIQAKDKADKHYKLPDPLLADMAIHHFDLMRFVTDAEPQAMYCRAFNPPWSLYESPPAASATLSFENDLTVTYRGSWVSPGPQTPWAGDWRMEFSGGELRWTSRGGPTAAEDRVWMRELGQEETLVPLDTMPYVDRGGALQSFVKAIRGDIDTESSGAHNRGSISMVFAAIDSSLKNQPVSVDTPV